MSPIPKHYNMTVMVIELADLQIVTSNSEKLGSYYLTST
jgi:hypothetical protein